MPALCSLLAGAETDWKRPPFEIRELLRDELPAAVVLLARAMRDDPMYEAVFGPSADHRFARLNRFYGGLLPVMGRGLLSAWDAGRLVGVLGSFPLGSCKASLALQLWIAYRMLSVDLAELWRLWHWQSNSEIHAPRQRHCQLGPVAVAVDRQRQGIGSRMLQAFCARMDDRGEPAFLETDKWDSVRFYQRFGFEVTARAEILGKRNWWMRRPGRQA